MASGSVGMLHRDLETLFGTGSLAGTTDRDLIERFATGPPDSGAEAAFEVLVTRHGPMVWRVCRNVLGDHAEADADDAFQATFLVLVKQRNSIRKLDSVASWLYGVAARVASRARVEAARRRRAEGRGIRLAVDSVDPNDGLADAEREAFGTIVQEEVRRLPERYRSVVLLCYWEGLTHEQAALRLGLPIGTVRSRMARARDLLRKRLVRRGLAPTALALTILADLPHASAAVRLAPVPLRLIRSSVSAAIRILSGRVRAELVSVGAAKLMRHVLWSLAMTRMKLAGVLFLATTTAAIGLLPAAQPSDEPRRVPTQEIQNRAAVPDNRERTDLKTSRDQPNHFNFNGSLQEYIIEPPDLLKVEVLQALPGRPISGERLVRPDGKISLGFYGDVYVAGLNLTEAKVKIIIHLRTYISDKALGLVERDEKTDKDRAISPADSTAVFVDVAASNSKTYYVLGNFSIPGRLPYTGKETVLDAVNHAGGIKGEVGNTKVTLYRPPTKGGPSKTITIPIDIKEIMLGSDQSTNYLLQPGDRLVAESLSATAPDAPPSSESAHQPSRAATTPTEMIQRAQLAHVIEPSDLILVEVLEALPGRPISGERLVRPDGTISLGFYGDVEVAGLTTAEAKEKIVNHLKKSLNDESLGLVAEDPTSGEPRKDENGKTIRIDPRDTDRVFVDVTAYNTCNYYVEGEVTSPGRLPVTGSERVLDVLHFAGGLLPWADQTGIKLIRSYPKGRPVQVLPIDYGEITMGTDQSTNYQIMPNDRIVVPLDPKRSKPVDSYNSVRRRSPRDAELPEEIKENPYFNSGAAEKLRNARSNDRDVEKRLSEMERKLDAILSRLPDAKPPAK
jgi:RNA polymerase sigma factor (sigma-70 family)